jgi:hypothetical protein
MKNKIAFTICSNNYLAQAKILGDSLCAHNPEYNFIVGLVDKKQVDIDYAFFEPYTIIPIEDISIPDFDSIWRKYTIIELNTSVKASFAKFLFKTYSEASCFFYFDPDIMVFSSLCSLEQEFLQADILLTPHINTPIPLDEKEPRENVFLNYGIYNLGFIGLHKNENTLNFLNWWEERILNYGHIDVSQGVFVDQLYINHVPLFFEKVKILKEYGYNAAPWNLHERKEIQKIGNRYVMNDNSDLIFYHFSSFSYKTPEDLSKNYNRYTFENCPKLVPLYEEYLYLLMQNNIVFYSNIPCWYVQARESILQKKLQEQEELHRKQRNTWRALSKKISKQICPPFLYHIFKRLFNFL